MAAQDFSIAIIGAGIGGLAAAAALRLVGLDVRIYEQASAFARIGAGIQQSPNSIKVLRRLGLEDRLSAAAFRPHSALNRQSDTGEVTWERMLGDDAERHFGAPYFLMHRGDLHEALASVVPDDIIERNRKLVGLNQTEDGVTLEFEDGEPVTADVVIGADGVHSVVREALLGVESPRWTGRVAYRTTYPASLLGGMEIDDCAKWWGPDRHIVMYYVTPRRDEIYFVTSTPEPDFKVESWSAKGDLDMLRDAYKDFHPQVRAVLDACPEVHKWALVERDPLPKWGEGRITLLGDACHPMTPYMAQGAATSIEDGAILSRCLDGVDRAGVARALRRYEDSRKARTARIQTISRLNDMNKIKAEIETTYGYDVWTAPLAEEMAE
ncbi:MAG: NAD(P)-binding protein [Rhodospirillaceae bacterium]|jgi:salicylate hydroxylase/6-hydroxynicotinate 3-monooxygenase|nr:NAD(P)-binding protein [Rhodospirillaceae bacterium]MBT5666334.1 NAD(P)-binding protein [Rhodospirillaceae bacterium]MBT5812422.1 NAD(P)-binding protein [Rhodospirillaceae bacterium]